MQVIDIYSKGEYPSNALSNFSPHAFVFDGVECASMEGFLQSLKFRDPKKQTEICALIGKEAKKEGSRKRVWKLTGNLYWKGRRYKRGSAEFYELRLNAYRAMLGNSEFREALRAAKGKTLAHSIGKSRKRATVLTKEEFINILYSLINEANL